MIIFQVVLHGRDAVKVYNCFRFRTNGTKVILDNYNIESNGTISFTLKYKNNDKLLFSIINTIKLCNDWTFDYVVYDLMQNDVNGKKRIIYFK